MAELDEPTDENKIENRSQNNRIFLCRIINLIQWFGIILSNSLLIVNVILTDGIRLLLNTLT